MNENEAISSYLEEVTGIIYRAVSDKDEFLHSVVLLKTEALRKLAKEGEGNNPYNSSEFKKLLERMEEPDPLDISSDEDRELLNRFAREFILSEYHRNPDQDEYDMEGLLKPFTDSCANIEKNIEAKRKDFRSRLNNALKNKSKLDQGLVQYKYRNLNDLRKTGVPYDRMYGLCEELKDNKNIYEMTINDLADNLIIFQHSPDGKADRDKKYPDGFDAETAVKNIEDTCARIDKNIADAEKARKFDFASMREELKEFSASKGKEIQELLRYRLMPNGKPLFSAEWAKDKDIPEVKQYCSALIKALESNRNVLIKRQAQAQGKSIKKGAEPKVKLPLNEYKGFIEDLKKASASAEGTFPEGYKLEEKLARVSIELSEFEFKYSKQLKDMNTDVVSDLNKKTQPLVYPADLISEPSFSNKEEYTKWRERDLRDKIMRILSSEDEIRPQDSLKMRLKEYSADTELSSDSDFMEMLDALKGIKYKERFGEYKLVETSALNEAVTKYAGIIAAREFEEQKGGREALGFKITGKMKDISAAVADSRQKTERIFSDPKEYYTAEIKKKTEEDLEKYSKERSSSVKAFLQENIGPALNMGLNPGSAPEANKPYLNAVLAGMDSLFKRNVPSVLQGSFKTNRPDGSSDFDKNEAEKFIDSLTEDLVSFEFYSRMRGINPDYNVIDVLNNVFKTALEEKEKLDPSRMFDSPDYDWSQHDDEKDDYVNDYKGDIAANLRAVISNERKGNESELNDFSEKIFSSRAFVHAIGEKALEFADKEYKAFREAFEFKDINGKKTIGKKNGFDDALNSFAEKVAEYEFREKKKKKLESHEFPAKSNTARLIQRLDNEEKYLKAKEELTLNIMKGLFVGQYQGDAADVFSELLNQMIAGLKTGHEADGSFDRIENALSEVVQSLKNVQNPYKKTDWYYGKGEEAHEVRAAIDKVSDILLMAGDPPIKRVDPDGASALEEGLPDKYYATRLIEGITNVRENLNDRLKRLKDADTYLEPALRMFHILNKTKGNNDQITDRNIFANKIAPYLSIADAAGFNEKFVDSPLGNNIISEADKEGWRKDYSPQIMGDQFIEAISEAPKEMYSSLVNDLKNMSWYPELEDYLTNGSKLEDIPPQELTSKFEWIAPALYDLRKEDGYFSELGNILNGLDEKKGFIIQNEGLKEYQGLRDALEDYIGDLKNGYKTHLNNFRYSGEDLDRAVKGRNKLSREIFSFMENAKARGWDVNPPKQLENVYTLATELYQKLELHEDQKAALLNAPADQNVRVNQEDQAADGFEVLDYRSLMHEEAFAVNQKMNFMQQKYGISEEDLNLLLSVGEKGGNVEKKARSVLEDIIERNMIPRDTLDPKMEDEFCRKVVKTVRNELEKGRNESARAELADGLMKVLDTSDFNPERDYMNDPFKRLERSGLRSKTALHNYFTFIKRDGYNPDSWYKSGTLKDMVDLWCEKRIPEDSTDRSRCMGMYEKVNAKWGFGDDMSMLFTKAMDKEFEELRSSMNLSTEDPNFKSRLYERISEKYAGTLDLFKDIVDKTPANSFGNYNIRLPKDIMDGCYFGGFNSYKLSVEFRPVTSAENLESVKQRMNDDRGASSWEGAFNRCKGLLTKVDEFDLCYNMFETKKRFRMFNGNSDEYKECMKALKTLKEKRNAALETCNNIRKAVVNDLDTSEFGSWDHVFSELDDAQTAFAEKLKAYNNKIFTESLSEKSQNAGMARFAGVQGLAEIVVDRNGMLLSQDNEFRKLTGENATKMKTYKELFAEEYNKGVVYGKENIHRKAAAAAREKQSAKEAQAPVMENPRRR